MKIKYLLIIHLLILTISCKESTIDDSIYKDDSSAVAQEIEGLIIKKPAINLNDTTQILTNLMTDSFPNFRMIDWESGDINKDNIADFIVVLESTIPLGDGFDADNFCRKVVLIETIKFPKLKITAQNDNLVGCSKYGGAGVGDPYQSIIIRNNYFSIDELYGACTKSYILTTFKYDSKRKNWILYKLGQDIHNCREALNSDGSIKMVNQTKTQRDFGVVLFEDYTFYDFHF